MLILWDIDQTLIEAGGVVRVVYANAFRQVTGRELVHSWSFDGRTELGACREVLRLHGIDPENGELQSFLNAIVDDMMDRRDELQAEGRVLPGVVDVLSGLRDLPDVHQSVLTGNLRPIAELKLTALGLGEYFDLRYGAYGEDGFERSDLPGAAFERTGKYLGETYTGSQTVIIGDTVRDVLAAKSAGARAVGVASGTTSVQDLEAAGADAVLPGLADTAAALRAIRTSLSADQWVQGRVRGADDARGEGRAGLALGDECSVSGAYGCGGVAGRGVRTVPSVLPRPGGREAARAAGGGVAAQQAAIRMDPA
jgi:phosphoglycolate phosphatase